LENLFKDEIKNKIITLIPKELIADLDEKTDISIYKYNELTATTLPVKNKQLYIFLQIDLHNGGLKLIDYPNIYLQIEKMLYISY
jgi:hypothetical protein